MHPACDVVYVGCDLEAMFWRVGPDVPGARLFAMNLPEAMDVRRRVLGDPEGEELVFDATNTIGSV